MSNAKALAGLRKTLKEKVADTWDLGTVIRFTVNGKYNYAVLKTEAGWYSTSMRAGFVAQLMDYECLLETLGKSEVSDVFYSTGWEAV